MKVNSKLLSLEERVFESLEEEILSGKLARGASLGEIALSERLGVSRTPVRAALARLAEDGLVVIVATVDSYGEILSGPDIVSRGFVYVKESEELMQRVKEISLTAIEKAMTKKTRDFAAIKAHVRDDVAKFIFKETKRKPMILPVLMDV